MKALAQKTALALALLLSGCVTFDRAMLVTSTATLMCDWGQTHQGAEEGWTKSTEANYVLGKQPSPLTVDLYFAGVIIANGLIWAAMPPNWRAAGPAGITAVESYTIVNNLKTTTGFCGATPVKR